VSDFVFTGVSGYAPPFFKVRDGLHLRASEIVAVSAGIADEKGAMTYEDTVFVMLRSGLTASLPSCETKVQALVLADELVDALVKAERTATPGARD
jgi:hypothetical protein